LLPAVLHLRARRQEPAMLPMEAPAESSLAA
jgi:hypothetical protein